MAGEAGSESDRPIHHLGVLRGVRGRGSAVAAALVGLLALSSVLVGCQARPSTMVMEDFESGAITGWQAVGGGSGGWFVYADGHKAPDPAQSDPNAPFDVPDPPQGRFAAVTDMNGPGTRILYRDLRLEGRSPSRRPSSHRFRPVQQPSDPGL